VRRPDPAENPIPLRAGPLSAEIEGADLVSFRSGGTEIASRILVTVRDERWGTVPSRVGDIRVKGATARIEADHEAREIRFEWSGVVEMRGEGELTFSLEGRALRDFTFRRIGVCVLHPWRTYVGGLYHATTPSGALEGTFPRDIFPQLLREGNYRPMIAAFSGLDVALPDGIAFDMALEGELFELEDQRNWTDASFKTYPTPLARSEPRLLREGDVVKQRVTLRIEGGHTEEHTDDGPAVIRIGGPTGARMPPVGVMLPAEPLSQGAPKAIRALAPAHVRGELLSSGPQALAQLAEGANEIGAPIELAILVDEDSDMTPLARALRGLSLARVFVHLRTGATIPGDVVQSVREQLGSALEGVPVAGGTWSHFSELNRLHPDLLGIDEVALSMSPQVHASDERSIVETLEIQGEIIRCARGFCDEVPIVVSPVTLLPYEPGQSGQDPRATQPLGSAWMLGSLASLAPAGVTSVTYEASDRVLADAISLQGSDVLDVSSSRPREVAALAVHTDKRTTLLLSNLTPKPKTVDYGNAVTLDGYGTARIEL
jgi:hypothetical protein